MGLLGRGGAVGDRDRRFSGVLVSVGVHGEVSEFQASYESTSKCVGTESGRGKNGRREGTGITHSARLGGRAGISHCPAGITGKWRAVATFDVV